MEMAYRERWQAVTQNRICAKAHFRFAGFPALQRKRAAPVLVTGWKPRESLSAPVAEIRDVQRRRSRSVWCQPDQPLR